MKVLITSEHVILGKLDDADGVPLSYSCAMHHALRPFIKDAFFVGCTVAYTHEGDRSFRFKHPLPDELFHGKWEQALKLIDKNGPYEIEVEGL